VSEHAEWPPADLARAYLDGGATLLQIRAKQLASGPFLDLCDEVVRLAERYTAAVIVNDRADLAALTGAAGVHVGQADLPAHQARRLLGDRAIVGLSTHTLSQIEEATREPVSYIAVGPVFGTRTKDTGYSAVGVDLISAAARLAGSTPIIAIGGITLDNAASVMEAGASGVAVIGDLLTGENPEGRVRSFVQRLAQHRV
jgi:thiamine-phosphate pyrophosphorylase